jgi:hypothetical protein
MANTPTENKRSKKIAFAPEILGASGLRQYGGFVHEEFLPELQGLKGARAYREMADNDPIIGAILFAITNLIRQAKWNVEAADSTPEAEAMKEFMEQVMDDMSSPWSSVIDEACSMFVYGYAPMEIIYKKREGFTGNAETRSRFDDGFIGIRAISLRAQNTVARWEIDPADGSIDGMWQQPWSGPMVLIPIEKMLLFRTTETRQNPEGRSILRTAYRSWHYKKRIENIEAIGVERDLAGLPVAYIPGNYMDRSADASQKAVYQQWSQLVTSIKRDQREGIVVPSDRDASGNLLFELKLLSSGGSRTLDTTKIIDRYGRAIATAVLADFIFLGQNAVGSFALSSDKTALFAIAIGAFMGFIADVFNRHLIPRLMYVNGWDLEMAPRLVPEDIETPDIAQVADFISKLSGAGAQFFPDIELENRLRQMAGLSPVPEDAADMREPAATPMTPPAEDAGGDEPEEEA